MWKTIQHIFTYSNKDPLNFLQLWHHLFFQSLYLFYTWKYSSCTDHSLQKNLPKWFGLGMLHQFKPKFYFCKLKSYCNPDMPLAVMRPWSFNASEKIWQMSAETGCQQLVWMMDHALHCKLLHSLRPNTSGIIDQPLHISTCYCCVGKG